MFAMSVCNEKCPELHAGALARAIIMRGRQVDGPCLPLLRQRTRCTTNPSHVLDLVLHAHGL